MNYYNEFDPASAAILRELMALGEIPLGDVDERSITDVRPDDLRGYTQCHFFAGIGGWSEALRLAGWPATRPVWTGSCPCQAFSCAGSRKGVEDARDLWPVFARLLGECRPVCCFGEQSADAIDYGWLDRLCADVEAQGYTCGATVLGAHSVGAPQRRQRLYWVADGQRQGLEGHAGDGATRNESRRIDEEPTGSTPEAGRSFWSAARPIGCLDGKTRLAESGIFPLAYGLPRGMGYSSDPRLPGYVNATQEARRMRLHGYGNAIVPQVGAMFVEAWESVIGGQE